MTEKLDQMFFVIGSIERHIERDKSKKLLKVI